MNIIIRSRPPGSRVRQLAAVSFALCFVATDDALANWSASPLVVHEWGVNTFDWNASKRLKQDLPAFLYTDREPGPSIPKPEKRVRDLDADSGTRTKPILYFYPQPQNGWRTGEPVASVEMRFAYGHANAWWPQVHKYRTEAMAAEARAPDLENWKSTTLAKYKAMFLRNKKEPKPEERWKAELAVYEKLDHEAQTQWLAMRVRWREKAKFPDDERMQLVWDRLTLHKEVPEGQALPGGNLPEDHWVKMAREVDAAYVSNGKEAERYVFYEGKTREQPVIALMPADGGLQWSRGKPEAERKEIALVNVGPHPIFEVIAIYRDSKKGILWTGFVPTLPSLPPSLPQADQVAALRIPDFSKPQATDNLKVGAEEFKRRTAERLLENLTAGFHYQAGNVHMRYPADPQPPTRLHQLFKKEAVALEKIWHTEFFESEGLTVLYRESPAYLDEAMPLNIFTSMYWYVKLSRCGLVLNRNLPIEKVYSTDEALKRFQLAHQNEHLREGLPKLIPTLMENRFLTMGQARYHYDRPDKLSWPVPIMEKVEKLFEE